MSAETDYLQHFIDKKWAFLHDPQFDPAVTGLGYYLQLGVEITIAEASQAYAYWENKTFYTVFSTGQKSYIKSLTSSFIETVTGFGIGPDGSPTPTSERVGLNYPAEDYVDRYFLYPPGFENWGTANPWCNDSYTRLQSVEFSLIPFYTGTIGFPPAADDKVHVRLKRSDNQMIVLQNVRYDETTHQLVGYSGSMERGDFASMWILSFFISPGPPG